MKKTALQFAAPILKIIWKIFKPQTLGVRAILVKNEKILLVKHSYSTLWYLPGGGMKKGETFVNALKRELAEELGIDLKDNYLHGIYNNFAEGKNDNIFVFYSENFEISGNKSAEIEEYNLFDFHQLPDQVSPGTKRRIEEFLNGKPPHVEMW